MLDRRTFTGVLLAGSLAGLMGIRAAMAGDRAGTEAFERRLSRIEGDIGGRLGVALLDLGTGLRAGWRQDERFPMCSTFKFLAAAAILARQDQELDSLERRVKFAAADLVEYSPATGPRADGEGMTLAELCEAAVTLSDNTAGNLMLNSLGGPEGLTAFARSLGDDITRLDRYETALNEALPGDPRDTTTPAAMLADMRELLLGTALSPASRERLQGWLVANKTGDARLRAGLPKDWRVGDKTGSGDRGTANDIAILWPPRREPMLVTVYLTGSDADMNRRNAAIAEVGKLISGFRR
ncbi:MAG: class A beta-lactamase [Pseudomonas indica]|nr:class A beta-lactamase [Pseudomonas indica]MBU3059262.1 class A beta-lactamase [Pseudomonas indica]